MPDQFTPTPVKTRENGDVVVQLVDAAGNLVVVTADGAVLTQANLHEVNGAPVDTGNGNAGAGTQRVVIADDNEPVQVTLTATDDPNAVANAVWTRLSDGTAQTGTRANPLFVVDEGTAAANIVDSGSLSTVDVAAGADTTLASDPVGPGLTGLLLEITASASVRTRVELRSGGDALRTFFVEANQAFVYSPKDSDFLTAAAGDTFDLVITNMDNQFAANVYGSITYEAR